MTLLDYLLLAAVAAGIFFAIRSLVRHKRGCHGGCDQCCAHCAEKKTRK